MADKLITRLDMFPNRVSGMEMGNSKNQKLTSLEIKFRLEVLVFGFSMTLYPLWRIVVYFTQNFSEPLLSRLAPIVFGASWLTAIHFKPSLRKYSDPATLILALMVTIEYFHLIYILGDIENTYSYTNYVVGSVIIMVAYISCMQSLKVLYIYSVACILIGTVTFGLIALGHSEFFARVDGWNGYVHQLTVVTIVFIITRQRLILETQLQRSVEESQASMISAAKMASLGVMSGGVAHEINNPLNVICGFSNALKRELNEEQIDRKALIEYSQTIDSTARKIEKIVRGLLEFSHASSSVSHDREPISIAKTLNGTLVLCEEKFRKGDIDVQIAVDSDYMIIGNKVQIEEVFLNLLSNAFDAIEESHEYPRRIDIEVKKQEGFALIVFRDTGVPISQEIKDRIFDPFFTTKEVGAGTGLGLSISRGIIESHNGSLSLNLQPKEMIVKLPLTT